MIQKKNIARTGEIFKNIRENLQPKIESDLKNDNLAATGDDFPPLKSGELFLLLAMVKGAHQRVGTLNPRPSGWVNSMLQQFKKFLQRMLTWYTRPIKEFQEATIQYLYRVGEILGSRQSKITELEKKIDSLSVSLIELQRQVEKNGNGNRKDLQNASDVPPSGDREA